jgi:glycosyltransferase involved in cell wall biosynthesis
MNQPLRVGIDARLVSRGLGVATYVRELVSDLVELDQVNSVVWFGSCEAAPDHAKVEPAAAHRLSRAAGAWLRAHVDLVHFAANTGWMHRGPVPSVVTVHDLIFMTNRGSTLRQQLGRRYMQVVVPKAAGAARRVIAVSEETAQDLSAAGWCATPIVIPHGIREVAAKPGPSEPYFVVFGGADPRKNVSLALDAFERAFAGSPDPPRLVVLAGAGLADQDAQRARQIDRVEVRPYLSVEAVRDLLRRSRALIHPTTNEGFGFPVIEGFAAGTPVIGGLTPVGRRIGGEALLRIDPADPVASLASQMTRLAIQPALARAAAAAGLRQVGRFSWRTCAERHAEVYGSALNRSPE